MNIFKSVIYLMLLSACCLSLDAVKKRKKPASKGSTLLRVRKTTEVTSKGHTNAEKKKNQKDTQKTLKAVAQKETALAATVADLRKRHITNAEHISICDATNTANFGFEGNGLIKQLPGLYQGYPLLEKRIGYGKNYGTLCGFYALYFAQVFAENWNRPANELIPFLNDRSAFDDKLKQWRSILRLAPQQTFNIQGNHIEFLLPQAIQQHIFVDGALADDAEAAAAEQFVARKQILLEAFRTNAINHVIFICPTDARGGHWITVLVRRLVDGNVEMIISDSVGIDRRNNEALLGLYADFTGQVSPAPEGLLAWLRRFLPF